MEEHTKHKKGSLVFFDPCVKDINRIADLFIGRGCPLYAKTNRLQNVLHVSCMYGYMYLVEICLNQHNMNIEEKDINNRTPLFFRDLAFNKILFIRSACFLPKEP